VSSLNVGASPTHKAPVLIKSALIPINSTFVPFIVSVKV
jgi:hypothetical protein